MKLAEALAERSDCQVRIEEMKERLIRSARMQESCRATGICPGTSEDSNRRTVHTGEHLIVRFFADGARCQESIDFASLVHHYNSPFAVLCLASIQSDAQAKQPSRSF
jgi:hypothetical protein